MSQDRTKPGIWFAEEWAAILATVLESVSGERPGITSKPADSALESAAEIAQRHGTMLWWKQPVTLPGEPVIWIGAPQAAWSQLGSGLVGTSGTDNSPQARDGYLDILRQSLHELAQSAGRHWNREVICSGGAEQPEPPAGMEFYVMETTIANAAVPPMLLGISGEPENPPAESDGKHAPSQSKTFDLLMGVELTVSVSFGHVQIPLKDILKLMAGSIVELNRMVDEPVEVIVNNCVVARGEVVTVEGNYGVRIHEIMSRQQRLESFR